MNHQLPALNVVVLGNGHYVSGMTSVSKHTVTDKDNGVILPALLELRRLGVVNHISVAARSGKKLAELQQRLRVLTDHQGWDPTISVFPAAPVDDTTSYKDALDAVAHPAAVLIAVPDHLHKEVALACISRGLPFFIVKPLVTKTSDLQQLLAALERQPQSFGLVDYHKVYDLANLTISSEYRSGAYGRLYHYNSRMTQRRTMLDIYSRWLTAAEAPNINHYLGSHYIHLAGFMTGAEPLDVRATAQFGVAAQKFNQPIPDLIQTQIRWREPNNNEFTSYHIAGWSDPIESESMTHQEVQLHCEHGIVDSDQRFRGFRKVLAQRGYEAPNPYFFNLQRYPSGALAVESQYGFISIRTFLETAQAFAHGLITREKIDATLPSIAESERVTAILEAADLSLAEQSRVVGLQRVGQRLQIQSTHLR